MAVKSLVVRFVGDTKNLRNDTEQLDKGFGGLAKTVGKLAVAAGGTALVAGLAKSITIGKEFEGTMNELGAVTGANQKQMEALGKRARELGSDIEIPGTSSAQAAGAMLELSKGGFSVKESMKAAKGTLILAAAAQIDGARAAEIQIQAINQFGLSAGDASHVADVLANTANAASGGIEDVAEAMKYVGPVARGLGISIDETSTAIGLLANNGILGSQAGTSLRAILAGLANPSAKASEALRELNIQAFDQQGEFVGLRKLTEQLAKAKGRLTQQEFAQASAAAFGREPLAAITALANSGTKNFDKMAKAVSKQGGATRVAASKMKGLGGALEQFKGQLEDVAIGVYQAISPVLNELVRMAARLVGPIGSVLTGVLNLLLGSLKAVFGFIVNNKPVMAALVAVVSALAARFVIARATVIANTIAFKAWYAWQLLMSKAALLSNFSFKALNATMRANPIGIIITALAALVGGFMYLWNTSAGFRNFWITIWEAIKTAAVWVWDNALKPAFNGIVTAFKWVAQIATWAWNNILYPIFQIWWKVVRILAAIWLTVFVTPWVVAFKLVAAIAKWAWNNVIKPVFNAIAAVAKWLWNNVLKPIFQFIWNYWKLLANIFKFVWNNVLMPVFRAVAAVAKWLWNNVLKPVFNAIVTVFRRVGNTFKWVYQNIIKPAFEAVGRVVRWVWNNIIRPAFDAVKRAVHNVGQAFKNAADWIKDVWNRVKGFVSKPIKWIVDVVWNNGIRKIWNGVAGLFGLEKLAPVKWAKKAKGGPIDAREAAGLVPGRGFQDRVPALLMPGEYVLPRSVVEAWGMDNIRNAHKTTLQNRSRGGLEGMNFQKMAAGGPVAMERAVNFAKSMNGKPYVWGGSSFAGTDCSGYMAMIKRAIFDQKPYARREWATGQVSAGSPPPGFVRGLSAGFSIGVNPGSHTAGTLGGIFGVPATNVESGGSHGNVAFGGPAVGADHSQFPLQFHLPMFNGKFVSGGQSGSWLTELLDKLARPLKEMWRNLVDKMPGQGRWKSATRRIPPELIDKGIEYAKRAADTLTQGAVSDDLVRYAASTVQSIQAVKGVASRYGWGSGPQWDALYRIIGKESSWVLGARNPNSSAAGLFQKMTSIHGALESTAAGQAQWGLNYIKSRYGNPINALQFHNSHGYYKQGTPWVPEDQYAFLHKGEGVIPRSENEARLRGEWGGNTYNATVHIQGSVYGVDDLEDAMVQVFQKIENRAGVLNG